MRKLASIKRISAIHPIDGKDRIALAIVDGWQVIVQKSDYKEGDLCVFCEIDSVLPDKPEFEFLRPKNFRIKTLKLSGVISQGICFPLSILPQKKHGEYKEEEDVTEIIGVTQYEPTMDKEPQQTSKKKYPKFLMRFKFIRRILLGKKEKKGSFPTQYISKTDETRIQNIPHIVEDKNEWIATEKIDGCSVSFLLVRRPELPFMKEKFEYIVCSRNLRLSAKDNSYYWKVSDKYKIESALRNMIGNREWIAIQGECIAPNVQGNKYKVNEPDLYVFNLIYPTGRAGSLVAKSIIENHGMKFVPIIDEHYVLPDTVNEVLDYAHGQSAIGDTIREGIVFRSINGEKSFKAVDPLFLMKYNE